MVAAIRRLTCRKLWLVYYCFRHTHSEQSLGMSPFLNCSTTSYSSLRGCSPQRFGRRWQLFCFQYPEDGVQRPSNQSCSQPLTGVHNFHMTDSTLKSGAQLAAVSGG